MTISWERIRTVWVVFNECHLRSTFSAFLNRKGFPVPVFFTCSHLFKLLSRPCSLYATLLLFSVNNPTLPRYGNCCLNLSCKLICIHRSMLIIHKSLCLKIAAKVSVANADGYTSRIISVWVSPIATTAQLHSIHSHRNPQATGGEKRHK